MLLQYLFLLVRIFSTTESSSRVYSPGLTAHFGPWVRGPPADTSPRPGQSWVQKLGPCPSANRCCTGFPCNWKKPLPSVHMATGDPRVLFRGISFHCFSAYTAIQTWGLPGPHFTDVKTEAPEAEQPLGSWLRGLPWGLGS